MTALAEPIALPASGRAAARTESRVIGLIVFAIAAAVAALAIDASPVGVVHDDGMYVILAKALATGQGYRWIHVPGAPAATHFPPGYPAFLALLWLVAPAFPANVLVFKFANALCTALGAAAVMRLVRDRTALSPAGAAAFALVATLGVPTLTLSVMVMSEPLFLLLVLGALLRAEALIDEPDVSRRDAILLGLYCGAATLVRTHGIALIGAIAIVLVVRRRAWREAAMFVVAASALLAPWQLWSAAHAGVVPAAMRGNYESYGAWLASGLRADGPVLLVRTAARTSQEIMVMFATLFAPPSLGAARVVAPVLLLALALAGISRMWCRLPITLLFVALYLAIVLLWPFTPARFVWAIWPLVLLLPLEGARVAFAHSRKVRVPAAARALRTAVAAAALFLVAGYGAYTVKGYRGAWWASIPRSGANLLRPLIVWTSRNTAPTDLVATEGESAVYLYTGRHTVPVQTFTVAEYFHPRTPGENAAVMRSILASYPVDHVVVSSPPMWLAARALATATPPLLVARDTFPGGIVLHPIHR